VSAPTLERLFDSPGLAGPLPALARFSPDGRRVAWLRPADDDHERLDLWLRPVDGGEARRLVDARDLGAERELSAAEKARRERARVFAGGIVEFLWSHDGTAILFPLSGRLWRLAVDGDGTPEPLSPEDQFVTDVRVAPRGGAVTWVHDGNLWLLEDGAAPRALTTDGGGPVAWGVPDFVAAEEMHRPDGYFFSPDGRRIAVLRVDETPIPVTQRYEIDGDGFSVHPQHYPYTGGPNSRTQLAIIDLDAGTTRFLEWRGADSEYLARVLWRGDGTGLWIQRQPRDQRTLELVALPLDGAPRVLLAEHSESWVNLTDDARVIEQDAALLWSSEADGDRRLYRVDAATGERRLVGPQRGQLVRLLSVDEAAGEVWVEARIDHPLRTQVHVLPLAGDGPGRRVSDGAGCHAAQVAPDHGGFLDRFESLAAPPALALRRADGSLRAELVRNDPRDADHPYHPYLAAHRTPLFGSLEAADGQTLHYRLTEPVGEGPRPVVVSVYGGPGVARVHDAWTPLIHQIMAQRGWGVLELDNRGAAGHGHDFEAPIFGRLGHVEVADQLRGVDFLKTLDWVDPARIAVFGHSYGGYMALMCLAQHPEVFRASVSVAPVTDWLLYDTHYTERYLRHPDANPEGYAASDVFSHLEGLVGADPGSLLLMHGMADDNVLFTHTTRLMKALQDRGVRFDLMTYPAAKHGLAGRATGLHRFRVITDFLARRFGESA
jgi:dipeptidyl-peptidase-4